MNNSIPENMLLALASPWSNSKNKKHSYKGFVIVVEDHGDTFDYEIKEFGNYVYADHDFPSKTAARKAAKRWIDNVDSDDRDYAQ